MQIRTNLIFIHMCALSKSWIRSKHANTSASYITKIYLSIVKKAKQPYIQKKGNQISLDLKAPVLPQNPKIRTLNQKFSQISLQIPSPKIIKRILLTLRHHLDWFWPWGSARPCAQPKNGDASCCPSPVRAWSLAHGATRGTARRCHVRMHACAGEGRPDGTINSRSAPLRLSGGGLCGDWLTDHGRRRGARKEKWLGFWRCSCFQFCLPEIEGRPLDLDRRPGALSALAGPTKKKWPVRASPAQAQVQA